jgi:hypothetical protein
MSQKVLADMSLDELFDRMTQVTPGSPNDQAVKAEIRRREIMEAKGLADKQFRVAGRAVWAAWASAVATAFAALVTCVLALK